jgi:hypothetical protein
MVAVAAADHAVVSLAAAPPNGHYLRVPRRAEREAEAMRVSVDW